MKFTEAQLEQAIISLLGEQGYPYVSGSSMVRTEEELTSSPFTDQLKVENRELFVVDQGTHSGLNLRVNYEV